MFLKSITLSNFKKYKEKTEFKFSGDKNVVKLANEGGKSTLIDGILAGFFEDVKSKADRLKEYQSWGSEAMPEIELVFEAGGENWRLLKNFEAKTVVLFNEGSGEKSENPKTIQEKIGKLLGITSRELMEKIAVFRQADLAETGQKDISAVFEILATAGGENIRAGKIISDFEKAAKAIEKTGRDPKTYGIAQKLEEKITGNGERIAEISAVITKIKILSEKKKAVSDALKKANEELKSKEYLWRANKELFEINEKIAVLRKQFDEKSERLEKFSGIAKSLAALEKDAEKYAGVFGNSAAAEDLAARMKEKRYRKEDRVSELRKSLGREAAEHGALAEFFRKRAKTLFAVGAVLTVLAAAASYFYFAFSAFLIFPSVLFVLIFFFSAKTDKKNEGRITELRSEIAAAEDWEKDLFKNFNAASADEIFAKIESYKNYEREREKILARKEGLGGEKSAENSEKEKKDLSRELGILEENAAAKKIFEVPKEEFVRFENEIKKLKTESENSRNLASRIEGEMESLGGGEEEKIALEEETAALQGELADWRRRKAVFEEAASVLNQARNSVGEEIKTSLVDFVRKFLGAITNGKYNQIFLGEDYALSVFSPEKRENVLLPASLSSGAIDQIYAALRFGFLKTLVGKEIRPLIFLDDPFHNFDPERLENTKQIIEELSKEFQIIILTCHDEYDDWK